MKRELLVEALRRTKGNRNKAAMLVGWSRTTVYRKLKEFCITKKDWVE